MLAVLETSFFHPKNVGLFNSKFRWVADANRTVNWLRPKSVKKLADPTNQTQEQRAGTVLSEN